MRPRNTTSRPALVAAQPMQRRLKRVVDRTLGMAITLAVTPILFTAAGAIVAEGLVRPPTRGPILYREPRISQGRVFGLLKFRTVEATAYRQAIATGNLRPLETPEHLTFVGKYLKRWYLDELPQVLNIARGEIGFVGTRPYPVPDYEAELARGEHRKRVIPAGLTGLTQIHKGRAGNRSDVEFDYEYYERYRSYSALRLLLYDLAIMLRTVRTVIEGKGL